MEQHWPTWLKIAAGIATPLLFLAMMTAYGAFVAEPFAAWSSQQMAIWPTWTKAVLLVTVPVAWILAALRNRIRDQRQEYERTKEIVVQRPNSFQRAAKWFMIVWGAMMAVGLIAAATEGFMS